MAEIRDREEFDTATEANMRKARFEHDLYGYDASAVVWQDKDTGKWVVSMSHRDSCD